MVGVDGDRGWVQISVTKIPIIFVSTLIFSVEYTEAKCYVCRLELFLFQS